MRIGYFVTVRVLAEKPVLGLGWVEEKCVSTSEGQLKTILILRECFSTLSGLKEFSVNQRTVGSIDS